MDIDVSRVKDLLAELKKDGTWLADYLGIPAPHVQGWFDGSIPPEEVIVNIKMQVDEGGEERVVPLNLEKFLSLQIIAARNGETLSECIARMIIEHIDKDDSSHSYTKSGNIISPEF